jgi:acyl-CoA synthetase (AMP-forming)/AMP-acid ligase II
MIITRNIMKRDIKIVADKTIFGFEQLSKNINQAKAYLIEQKNVKPGQKVMLFAASWPNYIIWFMACAELGLGFIVSDYPSLYIGSASVREKLSLYGEIDHAIGDIGGEYFQKISHLATKAIDRDAWKNYSGLPTPVWATEDTILIHSTTSGTTNLPKVCSHTHGFFANLMRRNADILGLMEDDHCLHTKILHHGSVAGVYFLPTLYRCKNHVWCWSDDCLDIIQSHHINRALLFYGNVSEIIEKMHLSKKINDNLTLYVLAPVPQDAVDLIVNKLGHKLISIYGCTETSGPLMLSTAPSNGMWDQMLFDGPLDNFYEITLDNDMITVTMPDGNIIIPGDRFMIEKNKWKLLGRENLYRIGDRKIYLGVLASWIEDNLNWKNQDTFDLVFDREYEAIYIRINPDLDISLDTLNQKILEFGDNAYKISAMIAAPRNVFYTGIKFDGNEVRLKCRRTLN